MDRKAITILKEYHQIFCNQHFEEYDVLGFFIFIREYISDPTLNEVCHFIAHRNRDRGTTYSFSEKINDALQSNDSNILNNASLFYDSNHIAQILNDFFNAHGLPSLDRASITEVIMCVISILQAVPITKRDGTPLCELEIHLFNHNALLAAKFNMMTGVTMAFYIMGIPYPTSAPFGVLTDKLLKAVRQNGKLVFVDAEA